MKKLKKYLSTRNSGLVVIKYVYMFNIVRYLIKIINELFNERNVNFVSETINRNYVNSNSKNIIFYKLGEDTLSDLDELNGEVIVFNSNRLTDDEIKTAVKLSTKNLVLITSYKSNNCNNKIVIKADLCLTIIINLKLTLIEQIRKFFIGIDYFKLNVVVFKNRFGDEYNFKDKIYF